MESYGLVGFYASMMSVLTVCDIGLTPTFNREMARLAALGRQEQEMRDTGRTVELLHWALMGLVALLVYSVAPQLGHYWFQSKGLSPGEIESAVQWMSLALTLQMVFNLYQGGLIGLQQQVKLNVIQVVGGVFRSVGVIGALWWVAPTIKVFLVWQVLSFAIQVLWSRRTVWQSLPRGARPRFRWSILRTVWRYAASMLGMSATSSLLMQADKLILSQMLPLEVFGHYSLAWSVAQTPITVLTAPVQQAFFPRLTACATRRDTDQLSDLYHKATQLVAVLVWPSALVIGFFAQEVLWVWIGDTESVSNTYRLVQLLIFGSSLQGILVMPYALQLANGWTTLGLRINIASVLVIIPAMFLFVTAYGVLGAGITWLFINLMAGSISVWYMHKRILPEERLRWCVNDVAFPLVVALATTLIVRWIAPTGLGRFGTLLMVGVTWAFTTGTTVMAMESGRALVLGWLRRTTPIIRVRWF